MDTLQLVIEFLGTFAFAISGIRWAAYKSFDWFGGYVVGLATAIGGGTIRDVMLGVTPFWMTNSIYMICTAAALLTVIVFKKSHRPFCQYVVSVRHAWPGALHRGRPAKNTYRGLSLLGGYNNGLHHWSRRWRNTRCTNK